MLDGSVSELAGFKTGSASYLTSGNLPIEPRTIDFPRKVSPLPQGKE
jgi:hypothetical protein